MVSRVNGFFQSVKKGIIARNAILIMGKPTSRKEGINERATFSIRNTRTTRIERMVESGGCRTVGRTVSVSRRSYLCGSRDASPYLARYALALRPYLARYALALRLGETPRPTLRATR